MKKRLSLCINKVRRSGIDAFLVSSSANISYLTGFRKGEGYFFFSPQEIVYFTNFIYEYDAKIFFKPQKIKVIIYKNNPFDTIVEYIAKRNFSTVGFEAKNMSFLEMEYFKDRFQKKNILFKEFVDFIESINEVKTKREISYINNAIRITEEGLDFIKSILQENFSERDIFVELTRFLMLKGDADLAFSPIVAMEKNSFIPHYIPGNDKIGRNRFVLIDCGARYRGYCADLTTIIFLDRIPPYIQRIYDIVRKGKDIAIQSIRDGVVIKEVDLKVRKYFKDKGVDKYFGHGLGHGVGIKVHEAPFLNPYNEKVFKEGMVVTVEPAVYLPGKFGIRLEDMVLVGLRRSEVLNGALAQ